MAVTKTLQRNQEAISWIPNSSGSAKLQRNYNYSYMIFELEVNYTCEASASFKYFNFANLIKKLYQHCPIFSTNLSAGIILRAYCMLLVTPFTVTVMLSLWRAKWCFSSVGALVKAGLLFRYEG